MHAPRSLPAWLRPIILLVALGAAPLSAAEHVRLEEDFEADLRRWQLHDAHAISVVDSGDPAHGRVLELRADGDGVYVLAKGSASWGALRVEADFQFPDETPAYLGFIYNHRRTGRRSDFGNLYIKDRGSYIRANPLRDGNVSRLLYEEYKTPLEGEAAIEIGRWGRLKAEVRGNVCHFYVADMATPKLTFDLFEGESGAVGFKPRVVGGPVWIDNVRITSIDDLAYTGPPIPDVAYHPEELITDWEVLGPLRRPDRAVEIDPSRGAWRPFETDRRGAVITGRVTEYEGERTVAYFRTVIHAEQEKSVTLHVTTVDELALFVNGTFRGFIYRDGYVSPDNDWNAWHDFWSNPEHAGDQTPIPLQAGPNQIVLRVRAGTFASGGLFARVGR